MKGEAISKLMNFTLCVTAAIRIPVRCVKTLIFSVYDLSAVINLSVIISKICCVENNSWLKYNCQKSR